MTSSIKFERELLENKTFQDSRRHLSIYNIRSREIRKLATSLREEQIAHRATRQQYLQLEQELRFWRGKAIFWEKQNLKWQETTLEKCIKIEQLCELFDRYNARQEVGRP